MKIKNIAIFILFLAAVASASAQAQPTNSITVEPIGFAYGIARVEWENIHAQKQAWALRFDYFNRKYGDFDTQAVGAGASYRFFLMDMPASQGLWVGPNVDILQLRARLDEETDNTVFYRIGAEAGYKWLPSGTAGFVVSPLVSLGYLGGEASVGDKVLGLGKEANFQVGVLLGLTF